MPIHHQAGDEQSQRYKSENRPEDLQWQPAKSAEMHPREPGQKLIAETGSSGLRRIEKVHKAIKRTWPGKINSRDSPHENKRERPKAQRAVQRPVEASQVRFPIDGQAAAPFIDRPATRSRFPRDKSRLRRRRRQHWRDARFFQTADYRGGQRATGRDGIPGSTNCQGLRRYRD